MKRVYATHAHLATRIAEHGDAYARDIEPATVTRASGGTYYDADHPAWQAAAVKYRPSRGLGDTIAKLTSAVGIKPCGGCKERARLLNKLVPYKT